MKSFNFFIQNIDQDSNILVMINNSPYNLSNISSFDQLLSGVVFCYSNFQDQINSLDREQFSAYFEENIENLVGLNLVAEYN